MTRTIGLSLGLLAVMTGCKHEPDATARGPAVSAAMAPAASAVNTHVVAASAGSSVTPAAPGESGPVTALGALHVGGIATGALDATDTPLLAGAVGDDFTITLSGGQTVTIVTRGGPSSTPPGSLLDVSTVLIHNGEEIARDDDSAGNHNSRIVHNVTETGPYVIRVSSGGSGLKRGTYTLQVYAGALPAQT